MRPPTAGPYRSHATNPMPMAVEHHDQSSFTPECGIVEDAPQLRSIDDEMGKAEPEPQLTRTTRKRITGKQRPTTAHHTRENKRQRTEHAHDPNPNERLRTAGELTETGECSHSTDIHDRPLVRTNAQPTNGHRRLQRKASPSLLHTDPKDKRASGSFETTDNAGAPNAIETGSRIQSSTAVMSPCTMVVAEGQCSSRCTKQVRNDILDASQEDPMSHLPMDEEAYDDYEPSTLLQAAQSSSSSSQIGFNTEKGNGTG